MFKEALKMTDTIEKFNSATVAVQQMTTGTAAGFKRGMNSPVFNLAAALQKRGITLGGGMDNM